MKKKYLLLILLAVATAGILSLFLSRTEKLDVEKFVRIDKQNSMKAALFIKEAMDSRTQKGEGNFRGFWRNVSDMQYLSNIKSLEGADASQLSILSVVSPKTGNGQVYVYARFPELEHDVQFVLENTPGKKFKIAGIYESRSFR